MRRFTRIYPCPICSGYDNRQLGEDRCWGFLSDDGRWAHCTRDAMAGRLEKRVNTEAYLHRLDGPCACRGRYHTAIIHLLAQPRAHPSSNGRSGPDLNWMNIADRYLYRDELGKLLYLMARHANPKSMRPWRPIVAHPDPLVQSHWTMGLKDKSTDRWLVRRVLYRLPEFLSAQTGRVMVVEGEKDVETLRRHGYIATCNPFRAGKWLPEFTRHFKDRDVVILPDNDDAGRRHAEKVARSVVGVSRSVKVLELPDLPPGGDISDWLGISPGSSAGPGLAS